MSLDLQVTKGYEESGIDERILRAIKEMGFESMTPIQEQAIPLLTEGKDIIGQAQTGTGKTAAFGIPILQMIDMQATGVQAIVLCPTRELAIQAAEELRRFGKFMSGIKVLPIYGGQDITKQIRSLKSNVSVVVGTPGRVMDHMRRHTLRLENIKMVVLDEADEMLNMGFREDIETILAEIPAEHQTALFSATMPKAILEITDTYQKNAVHIRMPQKELTIPLVKQYYYEVKRPNKEEVVARLLDYYNPKRSLIFCNTKKMVDDLTENLKGRGYFAEGLHGDLSQNQRDKVMSAFRSGTAEILIATDVAARGIDVDDVEAVFNYDVPQDIEYYVHRIGRTGRAGKTGRSFTLVCGREIFKIREIERSCNTKIKARTVPSAADITAVKSDKILNEAMKNFKEHDMTPMLKLVEDKINDEDITALELAAAFLQMHMGEKIEDLPIETFENARPRTRRYGENEHSGMKNTTRGGYAKRDSQDYRKDGLKKGRDPKTENKPEKKRVRYVDPWAERTTEKRAEGVKEYGAKKQVGKKPERKRRLRESDINIYGKIKRKSEKEFKEV